MKTLIIGFLILANAGILCADQPSDGFYLRAWGKPAPSIMGQDGQKLFLGEKKKLTIQKSELFSQNNANDRFYLSLTIPYDKDLGPSSYVLIVAGTAYRQSGSGASHEKTSPLSFYISGEESARQVSRYLKTPIFYRKHPRHNLRVSFAPTKKDFEVGEEVTVTLRIKNVGANTFAFMKGGRNRAARDNQYVFSARFIGRQVDDIGTSHHAGGLAVRRVVKPGEIFEDTISLSKWFSFDRDGTYEVHGSYYMDFSDPEAESWRTIWEDYASADFMVSIKKAADSSSTDAKKKP